MNKAIPMTMPVMYTLECSRLSDSALHGYSFYLVYLVTSSVEGEE